MAGNNTITAINANFLLSIPGLYNTPQLLQSYMADAAFAAEEVETAENVMGVDGIMSSGFIPQMYPQTISLQAGSPSEIIFETWIANQNATQDLYLASGTIQYTSTGRKYTLTNGVLTKFTPFPEAKKVLQGRVFTITWNNITSATM